MIYLAKVVHPSIHSDGATERAYTSHQTISTRLNKGTLRWIMSPMHFCENHGSLELPMAYKMPDNEAKERKVEPSYRARGSI